MNKIREWSFPVGLAIAWIVASAYTMSALAGSANSFARRPPVQQQVESGQPNT